MIDGQYIIIDVADLTKKHSWGDCMTLNKSVWQMEDKGLFISYLDRFKNLEKETWSRNILQTKLPLLCLKTKVIDDVVKEVALGNFYSFLDLKVDNTYESIAIFGKLLYFIEDFDTLRKYLYVYETLMENWAHCDLLRFNPKIDRNKLLGLVDSYINDERIFVRRLGLFIMYLEIKDKKVLDMVFKYIKKLKDENKYYIIMMSGWLLSEAIILYEDRTLSFIKDNDDLNPKIINKAIQKCRESRRVTIERKEALKLYKR